MHNDRQLFVEVMQHVVTCTCKHWSYPRLSLSHPTVPAVPTGKAISLVATPDIVSVLLSWEPPINGRGTVTQYTVAHGLADTQNLIASRALSGNTTSYRVTRLIPETAYRFAVTPSTSAGEGPPQRLTRTTQTIGECCTQVHHDTSCVLY